MKITMLTVGSTGDVRPYLLLGRELRSRGHDITIATFSRFREMIESAGLRFFSLSGDAEAFMASIMNPDTTSVTYLTRLSKKLKTVAPLLIRDMEESCRGAEAMICNYFGSVYYSVAEEFGIPCIQTQYFVMDPNPSAPISSIRSQRLPAFANKASYKAGYYLIGAVEKHFLGDWRKEAGLDPRKPSSRPNYRIGTHTIPVIYALSPSVFPRPEEWGPSIHMSGFWFDDAPAPWSPPADLESFLSAGDPPVYLGFGSMNTGDMQRLLTIVLRSLHAAGLRAVIASGWGGLRLSSNSRVFFTDYAPHDWLFPRVRAVIHHGGIGTTAEGLRWGKPTLIIPFVGDQLFWGERIRALGCGPRPISRQNLTVRKLTKAMLDLSSNHGYSARALEIAQMLSRETGVRTAADLVEREIANW